MALTPLQINTAARQRYNAVGDTFWSDDEIYLQIFQACCELATEGFVLESSYTASSVASQQQYTFPTQAVAIKRVTYDGKKLTPIDFREDDIMTGLNAATTDTGTPQCYAIWNDTLYLRPIPSGSSSTIKVFCNIEPGTVSASSTLEIGNELQMALVNFILSEMSAKNKNYQGAQHYRQLWLADVERAKRLQRLKKVRDAYNVVKNVDMYHQSDVGTI